jgi:hypothetical protein
MNYTVMDVLKQRLQELEDSHVQALAGGAVADYATYRELCGKIAGLQTAQREVADLQQRSKAADDHDD